MKEEKSELEEKISKVINFFSCQIPHVMEAHEVSFEEMCVAIGHLFAASVVSLSEDPKDITSDFLWGLEGYTLACKKLAESQGVSIGIFSISDLKEKDDLTPKDDTVH